MSTATDTLRSRACSLGLVGMLDRWDEIKNEPWLEQLLHHEEISRGKRSLDRRIKTSALGSFKLLADFDWSWPRKIDRPLIESLFEFVSFRQACVTLVSAQGKLAG